MSTNTFVIVALALVSLSTLILILFYFKISKELARLRSIIENIVNISEDIANNEDSAVLEANDSLESSDFTTNSDAKKVANNQQEQKNIDISDLEKFNKTAKSNQVSEDQVKSKFKPEKNKRDKNSDKKQVNKGIVVMFVISLLIGAGGYYYFNILNEEINPEAIDPTASKNAGTAYGSRAIDGDECFKQAFAVNTAQCADNVACMRNLIFSFAMECMRGIEANGKSLRVPCELSEEDFKKSYCSLIAKEGICVTDGDLPSFKFKLCQPKNKLENK